MTGEENGLNGEVRKAAAIVTSDVVRAVSVQGPSANVLPDSMAKILDQRVDRLREAISRLAEVSRLHGDVSVIAFMEGVCKLLESYEVCARRGKPHRPGYNVPGVNGIPPRRGG